MIRNGYPDNVEMVPGLRREVAAQREMMAQMEQEIQRLQAREQHLMATNESRMGQITDLNAELRKKGVFSANILRAPNIFPDKSEAAKEKKRTYLINQLEAAKRENAELRGTIRKRDGEVSLLQGTREILQKKHASLGRYYVAKINAKNTKLNMALKANEKFLAVINQTKQNQAAITKKLQDFLEVGFLSVMNSKVNELHLKTAQLLDTEERIKNMTKAVVALRNQLQIRKASVAVTTPARENINADEEAMDFESGTD
ncbi:hypothetical protein B9Z55_026485 [Caenorhabditis nigoni]|uniref:DUF4201 domain-containing protein n=1 Tax=Caenorhabditis nigoni TaxID=1611254 RepID=A0A2G5T3H6_9PELO|nr:hypothetical protein B9Z55_026485 [Caenorhabditis nigoni]